MRDRILLLLLCASAAGLVACDRGRAPLAAPPPAERTPTPASLATAPDHRDLSYADGARRLDLYLPERPAGPAPVAVWLHGGSWVAGSKTPAPRVLLDLRGRGFAVAAVDYRLSGLSSHPAQVHDVKGAVRWLRAHARDYGLDPSRVYLVGFSAGGHLAALAALTAGDPAAEGDVGGNLDRSSAVAGVVVYAGAGDLPRLAGECVGCETSEQFLALGCSFLLCGERGRLASPVTYARRDAPPFLLLHGDADRVIPLEQSTLLDRALREAGASSRLVAVEGAPHGLLDARADGETQRFLLGLAGLDGVRSP